MLNQCIVLYNSCTAYEAGGWVSPPNLAGYRLFLQ